MRLNVLIIGSLAAAGGVACETDDVGKACGVDDAGGLTSEPVLSEDPDAEVVRMQRDGVCQTFQCLEHLGIPPYCTRSCKFTAIENRKDCSSDADCNRPQYCYEGKCADDDCPEGFWCRGVQNVGPLGLRKADPEVTCTSKWECKRQQECYQGFCHDQEHFCAKRSGCDQNLECEVPGEIDCVAYGCFDNCCLEPDANATANCICDFHRRRCDRFETLPCECFQPEIPLAECPTDQIVCQTDGQPQPWDVRQNPVRFGICEKVEP